MTACGLSPVRGDRPCCLTNTYPVMTRALVVIEYDPLIEIVKVFGHEL